MGRAIIDDQIFESLEDPGPGRSFPATRVAQFQVGPLMDTFGRTALRLGPLFVATRPRGIRCTERSVSLMLIR